jgi:MFS family permease
VTKKAQPVEIMPRWKALVMFLFGLYFSANVYEDIQKYNEKWSFYPWPIVALGIATSLFTIFFLTYFAAPSTMANLEERHTNRHTTILVSLYMYISVVSVFLIEGYFGFFRKDYLRICVCVIAVVGMSYFVWRQSRKICELPR